MSAYMVGAIDIADPVEYAEYQAGAQAALAPFGVEVLSVDGQPILFEGQQPGKHLFIVRFPSLERLQAFFNGEGYQKIVHHRHGSSATAFIMGMRGLDEA